ncbi:FecR family protein [Sphingobacterium faecale]|uniref:FecR domain-containing protein n=1 Tax=Sphingobacterium faecale TaxID=2803775 RepID=A0ABS1R5H9_9SPHI|nr:FecR family protein [Sphingobacterium faecale]MBL1409814.1 FecR domain-containing protein [Sphingobacterium faecale]
MNSTGMNRTQAQQLLDNYHQGKCSASELALLHRWYAAQGKRLEAAPDLPDPLAMERLLWQRIEQDIDGVDTLSTKVARFNWIRWLSVAASLLIVATFSVWYYSSSRIASPGVELHADIPAGSNRATFTLSDGHHVALSEAQGTLVSDGERFTYADGTSVLDVPSVQMATVTTPRSGQYQVVLPDGSHVWLNAASSIRYPTRFSKDVRRVELEGEAYFEVKKGQVPFVVSTAGPEIRVLGTAFNVMAYSDEPYTQTTLVEGSVRLTSSAGAIRELVPGMQAIADRQGIRVQEVDVVDYTSWKDGIITLEKQTLSQIFRQLGRWYDVEFVVERGVSLPSATLSGDVLRDLSLHALLQTLAQQTGLQFELNERRVIVRSR